MHWCRTNYNLIKNEVFRCLWFMMQYIVLNWLGYGAVYFAKFGV